MFQLEMENGTSMSIKVYTKLTNLIIARETQTLKRQMSSLGKLSTFTKHPSHYSKESRCYLPFYNIIM